MPKEIKLPLFPLNLVLLPNEEITLHIFEDKYKEMVTNCIDNNEDFGIILKSMKRKPTIGCTAQIVDVIFEDNGGEYDILIRGGKRFAVNKSNSNNKNLLFGYVSILKESAVNPDKSLIKKVQDKYLQILLNHKLIKNLEIEMKRVVSYDFIKKIILPNNLKQTFLEINCEEDRMLFLDNLFEKVILAKHHIENVNNYN